MSPTSLQSVAASPALRDWALACPEATFTGTCRFETRHATYLFRNGRCFAVSGRGPRGGTTSSDLVGMTLGGWLLRDDDARNDDEARRRQVAGGIRVSRNWRPGARAVLFGKAAQKDATRMAITSPVDAFTTHGEGAEPMRPPTFDRSPTGSLTRVGVAIPAA